MYKVISIETFGYTKITTKEGVEVPFEPGMELPYMVMPTWNYYEEETWLEIKFHPLYNIMEGEVVLLTPEQIKNRIDIWKNSMNVTAPISTALIPFALDKDMNFVSIEDPFFAEIFSDPDLDMNERLKRYSDNDLSALSGSDETGDVFLLTAIADSKIFR